MFSANLCPKNNLVNNHIIFIKSTLKYDGFVKGIVFTTKGMKELKMPA